MNEFEGKLPTADWMEKYNGCNCGCGCEDTCPPCPPSYPGICPPIEDVDSDTMYQQMQYCITKLEQIIKALDLPDTTKFEILHLATCNIKVCMNLLKLIQKNAADIAVLNEQMTAANGKIEANETEIADVKGSISAISTEIATLNQKHNNQQTQINDNATAINELRHHKISRCEFEKVAYSVCEHHKAIANLETTVANNKTAVDNALAETSKKVDTLDGKVTELTDKVQGIVSVVTPAKIAAIDAAIAENAKGIELVKSAVNNNREFIGKVAEMVHQHDHSLNTIVEDHKSFAAKIASNEAGVEANRKQIVANTAAIETLQATDDVHGVDIAKLKVRCDGIDRLMEERYNETIQTNTSINNRLVALEAKVPMIDEDHSNLDALEEKIAGIEAKVESNQTVGEETKAKLDEVAVKVEQHEANMGTIDEAIKTTNENMVVGFENINNNTVTIVNTINDCINKELRPGITANTEAIAQHTQQIGDLIQKDTEFEDRIGKLENPGA